MRIRDKIGIEHKSEVTILGAVEYKRDHEIRIGENNVREYKVKIQKMKGESTRG